MALSQISHLSLAGQIVRAVSINFRKEKLTWYRGESTFFQTTYLVGL
jgi:hypothetical protein